MSEPMFANGESAAGVCATTYADERQWLDARMHGIGGSDAPVIMGLTPWETPYTLALRKRGLLPDKEQSERMRWGLLLEGPARDELARESGCQITAPTPWTIHRLDFVHATVDGFANDGGARGVVEIKSSGVIPDRVLADPDSDVRRLWDTQLLHNMNVVGSPWGLVGAILGGQRFRWYRLEMDEKRLAVLVAAEREFWDLVQRGDSPPVDDSEVTRQALRRLHPNDNGKSVSLKADHVLAFEEWDKAARDVADAKQRARLAENRLAEAMAGNTFGVLPNGVRLSFRTRERSGFTVKPSTYRVLMREK